MKAIINANVYLEYGLLENATIVYDEKIISVSQSPAPEGAEIIDAKGKFVFPGLIDIHLHGYFGHDMIEGTDEAAMSMAKALANDGVTGFLPAVMTAPLPVVATALNTIKRNMGKKEGARILGAHLEGLFISKEKKGAHDPNLIIPPDYKFVEPFLDVIKIMITAPELYPEFVSWTVEHGVISAMGHTNATYEQAMEAIRRGSNHVTHLFNGMRSIDHRQPGIAAAALLNDSVNVELIADTAHVSKELHKMVYRLKGPKNIALITDSSLASGLAPGTYSVAGETVIVDELVGRHPDGTICASAVPLRKDVLNFSKNSGCPMYEAVNMASLNPARILKIDDKYGSILPGKYADMFIADSGMNLYKTIIAGEVVCDKE